MGLLYFIFEEKNARGFYSPGEDSPSMDLGRTAPWTWPKGQSKDETGTEESVD